MIELPFSWSATFVINDVRATVDVKSDDLNPDPQKYVSFTGTFEGGGQIVDRLRAVAEAVNAVDVMELCDEWDALHMKRFADFTPEQWAMLEGVRTSLVLVNGERYGEPGDLEDIDDADFSNASDVIDSRDVIKRIEYLEGAFAAAGIDPANVAEDADENVKDAADELKALKALEDEASSYASDWRYGAVLVRDSYFEDHARDEAESIGAIDKDAGWPLQHIDWPAAAESLKQDYTEVDFDGVAYYVR